jgi:hydrophobic/amphiphilic exporter-1 (mainly G- bacteria), HAE1 family
VGWFRHVLSGYTAMLKFAMGHRWVIIVLCVVTFASIVPLFMFVGKNFLPVDDQSQFEVSVRAPEGYSLGATSLAMERVAAEIRKLPGITDTLATAGGGQDQVVNSGTIYVKLSDLGDRSESQEELMSRTRDLLASFPDLRTAVQQVAAFSGGGFRNANVQFLITGPDLKQLEAYSEQILEKMRSIPDAVDVDTTLISGKPEVRLEIDRARAADLGVRIGDISQALNTLVAGQDVTTFNEGTDQYDVVVRAQTNFRTDKEGLRRMIVPSSTQGVVSLDRLITTVEGTGPSSIERTNRQRQVTLLANTRPGGSAADITGEIDRFVAQLDLPPGILPVM